MTPHDPVAQWTLDVTVYHGPQFGHRIHAAVLRRSGGWHPVGDWQWTGLGVPEPLVADCAARIHAVLTEYLISRYGLALQLWKESGGEAETT